MRRTRDALHEAMLVLIASKPFDKITVRDITAKAEVGYATFFRHYPSKEALLEETAAGQIRQLVEMSLPAFEAIDSYASCLALCSYVDEHRALWSALLSGGAQQTMREELIRVSTEVASMLPSKGVVTEVGIIVSSSSIVEILSWWLRQPKVVPSEEIAAVLNRLVIGPIVQLQEG